MYLRLVGFRVCPMCKATAWFLNPSVDIMMMALLFKSRFHWYFFTEVRSTYHGISVLIFWAGWFFHISFFVLDSLWLGNPSTTVIVNTCILRIFHVFYWAGLETFALIIPSLASALAQPLLVL